MIGQGALRTCARLLPGKLRAKVENILALFLRSVRQYGKDPAALAKCLGLSLLFQFLVIVAVFCVGASLLYMTLTLLYASCGGALFLHRMRRA
jgi:hypothetical protein